MHLNAIGNRNVSYNQESFVTAYYDVLIHGFTITKAGLQHSNCFNFFHEILIFFLLDLFTTILLKTAIIRLPQSTRFLARLWNIM